MHAHAHTCTLGPAFAPGDYTSIFDAILQFDGTTTSREVSVTIEDDNLVEFLESFQGLLTTSDPAVDLAPSIALIEIVDDDGELLLLSLHVYMYITRSVCYIKYLKPL